jgi:hypothetical protein
LRCSKLGYKNAKLIKAIEVTNSFTETFWSKQGFQLVRGDLALLTVAGSLDLRFVTPLPLLPQEPTFCCSTISVAKGQEQT